MDYKSFIKFNRFVLEAVVIVVSFIALVKGFRLLEDSSFADCVNFYLSKEILTLTMFISMIISIFLCSYFKPILEPAKFMKNVTLNKNIDFKKLFIKKELLLLILLAIFFYFSYNNIIYLNNYSEQALFLLLTMYIPLSTLSTIKKQLQKNNLTLKQFKEYKAQKNDK